MSIKDKVVDIIADQLEVSKEKVTDTAKITDLGGDSLDAIEIIMALEVDFNIEIEDEEAEKLLTVGDIVKYIEEVTK